MRSTQPSPAPTSKHTNSPLPTRSHPLLRFASIAILALTFAALWLILPAHAAPKLDPIPAALAYLHSQQQPDGGIDSFGFGMGSDPGGTARVALAFSLHGENPAHITHTVSGASLMDYLQAHAYTYTHDADGDLFPAQAGLILAAASAANANLTTFGGMNLINELHAAYNPATGAYSTTAQQGWNNGAASDLNQGWSIFGLAAAGEHIPTTATQTLLNWQAADGTWGYGDPDTTALATLALIASGNVSPTHPAIQNAITYFQTTQTATNGWRPGWDSDPLNVSTTGWAVQALQAAGYLPVNPAWGNPQTAILTQQQPNGSIGGTYVNAYSTAEALFGLSRQNLAFLGKRPRIQHALNFLATLQQPNGGWQDFFSPLGTTADVALAFSAAGYDPHQLRPNLAAPSAMDYLQTHANTAADPATLGKLTLAAAAAGADPYNFGSLNLPNLLTTTHYNPAIGAFGVPTNTWHQAFALIGLKAANAPSPISATQTLLNLQQPDGGWKYDLGAWSFTSDTDSTALALQALLAAGVPPTHTAILNGRAYLQTAQIAPNDWGNTNSTAFALQALYALGETPALNALYAYQKPDGPFVYAWNAFWTLPLDDVFATRQAIPALAGRPLLWDFAGGGGTNAFQRGAALPDGDRALPKPPSRSHETLILPLASDLNQNAALSLEWTSIQSELWQPLTPHRADGYFSATLPITAPLTLNLRVTLTDPDGIQLNSKISQTWNFTTTLLAPYRTYLPLLTR